MSLLEKTKQKEKMKFGENGLCQFCRKPKAEIPITDSETEQEVWICELCDGSMNWEKE